MAEAISAALPTRDQVVPSRKRVKLPPWLEVAKPRLIPLLLATTLGGMALTEGWPLSSPRLVCTLGGGALASAAAGVLNCLWEQDLDGRMARTSGRALPSGRLSPTSAFIGAIACTLAAAMLLVSGVNCLAAGLSLLGLCSYVLLYTALLKPRTTQNIVIGGVAGAIPPLVGAAAATGHVGLGGWWLFALVMVWTPAHFWALALVKNEEYTRAGIPMLPVVAGRGVTRLQILLYAVVLAPLAVAPTILGMAGLMYGAVATLLGGVFVWQSARLFFSDSDADAMALFKFSIIYLFLIFLSLGVDAFFGEQLVSLVRGY